jgi:hypothetical protein
MGLFDNIPGAGAAGGDWQKQAADAQAAADKIMRDLAAASAPDLNGHHSLQRAVSNALVGPT